MPERGGVRSKVKRRLRMRRADDGAPRRVSDDAPPWVPGRGFVAFVSVLCGAALAVFALAVRAEIRHVRDNKPAAPPNAAIIAGPDDGPARAALFATFEAGQRATWLVEYNFDRKLTNGKSLAASEEVANRPPDRVAAGLGGISGVRDGHQIACNEVDGSQVCAPSGPSASADAATAEKLANLRDALEPPNHWYRVTHSPAATIAGERATCFALQRIAAVPAPPYGERALLCFGHDGVPLRDRTERIEGVDDRRATTVRRDVTAADLDRLIAGG
jgi:hypothetical protein